jgi:hypothetical protein
MHAYVSTLIDSELPLEPWLVGVVWLLLLSGTHIVGRKSRLLLRAQEHVVVEENAQLHRSTAPRFIFVRLIVAVVLFSLCYYLGEPVFTFIVGGFVAALAMAFGLNLHSLAFAQRLHNQGDVTGKVTLSAAFVFGDMGRKALGCAAALLVTGLVLAQLALLGGALILASTGVGYVRRSRQRRAQP